MRRARKHGGFAFCHFRQKSTPTRFPSRQHPRQQNVIDLQRSLSITRSVGLVVAAVLIAACGSSDDSSGPGGGPVGGAGGTRGTGGSTATGGSSAVRAVVRRGAAAALRVRAVQEDRRTPVDATLRPTAVVGRAAREEIPPMPAGATGRAMAAPAAQRAPAEGSRGTAVPRPRRNSSET